MRNVRRTPSRIMSVSAPLACVVFLFTVVMAQMPFCQCGIICSHHVEASRQVVVSAAPEVEGGCCSSEGQDVATTALAAQTDAPADDKGVCPCPVEIRGFDSDLPSGPIPSVIISTPSPVELVATPVEAIVEVADQESDHLSQSRPTRGSPLPRPPVNVLNSVYII